MSSYFLPIGAKVILPDGNSLVVDATEVDGWTVTARTVPRPLPFRVLLAEEAALEKRLRAVRTGIAAIEGVGEEDEPATESVTTEEVVFVLVT